MRRRDFIMAAGGSMVFPLSGNAQQSASVDAALGGAVERKEVAGVVAMAADAKGVIYQGAFGMADIAEARPLKIDSLFRIASMTKAITSVAAMQLIEQGRLALDDPAEKYLPQLAKLLVFQDFDGRPAPTSCGPPPSPSP
jgi:methyl acetate hydrolase